MYYGLRPRHLHALYATGMVPNIYVKFGAMHIQDSRKAHQLRSRQARGRRSQLVAHASQPRRDGGPPCQPLRCCSICFGVFSCPRMRAATLHSSNVTVNVAAAMRSVLSADAHKAGGMRLLCT